MVRAKVFISYCQRDKQYVERLQRHLSLLKTKYAVEIWDDSRISAGENWQNSIEEALASSDFFVCLLSVDFFTSEFISDIEIPAILRGVERGKRVLPIYVGPLGIHDHALTRMQSLNKPEQPLRSMSGAEQEAFYAKATKTIREALRSIADTPPLEATAKLMRIERVGGEVVTTKLRQNHLEIASNDGPAPYNIVLIGRTGVGKSELFNYLFGKPLQKVGVGKPVTERGFHKQSFELKSVRGNLFDSWGLEVGNHEEWQKELNNELSRRGTDRPPEEWFHTILFCVDASGARVQPFEVAIIRTLREQKYNVIVVLTKCDVTSVKKRGGFGMRYKPKSTLTFHV